VLQPSEEFGLAQRWGWLVLRGVVAILFALLAFARPGVMGVSLVLAFGAFVFIEGAATLFSAVHVGRANDRWGVMLVEGLLGLAVGVLAIVRPGVLALGFIWVIAAWAVVTGALAIVSAIRLRKVIRGEWAMMLAGALSVAFGLGVLVRPLAGGVAIVWWLGAYAMAFGVLSIVLGLRLRRFAHPTRRPPPQWADQPA
jgi:uncharacterized membrane protein HdeD (DUF308 family)